MLGWENNDICLAGMIDEISQLSNEVISQEVINELNTLRCVSNSYHHYEGEERELEKDAIKDRYTCYVALLKVCKWYVDFPIKLKKYLWKQEEQRKQSKENWTCIVKFICLPFIIIGAIITAIFCSKK